MRLFSWIGGLVLALVVSAPVAADQQGDGFVPMFNGKDLTGWVNVNCRPETFYVKDGAIITTGEPTGYLRTMKQYENFVAEFDWMHVPPQPGAVGNSGFFVWCDPIPAVGTGYTRGIEVQVLVNLTHKNKKGEIIATSQGDLFSIHGATCVPDRPHPDGWARCLPSENHCKGELEWNHYRVEANDGRITLAVNGHVVSGISKCKPRKGYLALESEGSECHFKNLKIKELPSTNPKKDEIADEDKGFESLYPGDGLRGWQRNLYCQYRGWMLHYGGKGERNEFRTRRTFHRPEFSADLSFSIYNLGVPESCTFILEQKSGAISFRLSGDGTLFVDVGEGERQAKKFEGFKPAGKWNRVRVARTQTHLVVTVNGESWSGPGPKSPDEEEQVFVLRPAGPTNFANLFVRELGKRD